MTEETSPPLAVPWAGFWPRLGAFVVDSLILGALGWVLGLVAFDALASLGSTGRLIGLVIGVAYLGVLGSTIGGGQTLGKRLLKLRVIRQAGGLLSLPPALGRAFLLMIPIIMNGWFISYSQSPVALIFGIVAFFAVFGLGLGQIYLLLFNRPSRRLIHDLVFGTVVVKAGVEQADAPLARLHRNIVGALLGFVLVVVVGLSVFNPVAGMKALAPLTSVQRVLNALPEVIDSGVQDNTNTSQINGGSPVVTRTLIVIVRLRHWPADKNAEIGRIARTVIGAYRFAPGQQLQVRLVHGFDIGIASGSFDQTDTEDPSHWVTPPR